MHSYFYHWPTVPHNVKKRGRIMRHLQATVWELRPVYIIFNHRFSSQMLRFQNERMPNITTKKKKYPKLSNLFPVLRSTASFSHICQVNPRAWSEKPWLKTHLRGEVILALKRKLKKLNVEHRYEYKTNNNIRPFCYKTVIFHINNIWFFKFPFSSVQFCVSFRLIMLCWGDVHDIIRRHIFLGIVQTEPL